MPRSCDCPNCKARRREEFEAIASSVFTDAEASSIAERTMEAFGAYRVNDFLHHPPETDDDGA